MIVFCCFVSVSYWLMFVGLITPGSLMVYSCLLTRVRMYTVGPYSRLCVWNVMLSPFSNIAISRVFGSGSFGSSIFFCCRILMISCISELNSNCSLLVLLKEICIAGCR